MRSFKLISSILVTVLYVFSAQWSGSSLANAQSSSLAQQEIMLRLKSSIMAADASALADETVYSVEIALFGEARYYSRGQATLLLKTFFDEYPPLDFDIEKLTRTPTAGFLEATYVTSKSEAPLRMYVRLRIAAGQWKIRELLIEESDG